MPEIERKPAKYYAMLTRAIGDNLELLQLPKALAPGDTMAAPQPRGAVTVPLAPATSP